MKSTPKSPKLLQAQIESFAEKGLETSEKEEVLEHLDLLSKTNDFDSLTEGLPVQLDGLINKYRKKYTDFLRKEKKDEIELRRQCLECYEEFKPAIQALKERIQTHGHNKPPEYLGSGRNADVFRIDLEGKSYAVKISKAYLRTRSHTTFGLDALLLAKGIEHTAQLVAYSIEDDVVITELLPGKEVTKVTLEERPEYSEEDIIQLIETVRELDQKGVQIDAKPSNFMHDPQRGFSVLDFQSKKENSFTLADAIMSLRHVLLARKQPELDRTAPDYDKQLRAGTFEYYKAYLSLMLKFLPLLDNKYPGVIEEWEEGMVKRALDDPDGQRPLIDHNFIMERYPKLHPLLKKLSGMGF